MSKQIPRHASGRVAIQEPSRVWPLAEKIIIFIGILMLLEIVRFVLSGNAEPEKLATAETGNPLVRLSWYPLYLGLAAAMAVRLKRMVMTVLPGWPIYLMILITLTSVFSSVAPDITSRRIIALIFTVLFGVYLAARGDWFGTLRLIGFGVLTSAFINLGVSLLMPAIGVDQEIHIGAWKGITVEKNALGGDMARGSVVLLALAHLDVKHRWPWLAGYALTFLMVLASTSTTALLAALMIPALLGLFIVAQRSAAMSIFIFYGITVSIAAIAVALILFPEQMVALIGKDMTLTGRTGIWKACLRAIQERPLTGFGLGAFWVDELGPSYYVVSVLGWEVPSAHNNWLEIGLALGFPGMATLGAIVLGALFWGLIRAMRNANPWPLIGVTQMCVFSFSESAIFWHQNTFSCTLFVFFAALCMLPVKLTGLPATNARQPKAVSTSARRLASVRFQAAARSSTISAKVTPS